MHTQKTGWLSNIGMQVVIAMIIGAAVGALMGESAAVFAPLGAIFIHLIKMLVVSLVAVAIISGPASLGNSPAAGKIGITTFAFFMLTSAAAVALAILMGEMFRRSCCFIQCFLCLADQDNPHARRCQKPT